MPDLFGMGESDARPYLPVRDETARVLLDSMDGVIGTETFDFVGFSFGGALAAIATGLAPERVRSLTLVLYCRLWRLRQ